MRSGLIQDHQFCFLESSIANDCHVKMERKTMDNKQSKLMRGNLNPDFLKNGEKSHKRYELSKRQRSGKPGGI